VKVLLDENLDHALRKLLGPHEVVTVTYMGWTGLQNGALLRAAEESGMDVLLTGDQTLNYEQNLTGRRLAIVALSAIQLPILKENLAKIIAAVDAATPGTFQAVDCGTFSRKKTPKE
jgi:electron transfer flavoprotein alpha/beta subunit